MRKPTTMRQAPVGGGGSGFGKSKRETKGYPDSKMLRGAAQNGPAARMQARRSGIVPAEILRAPGTWSAETPYVREFQDYVKQVSDSRAASVSQAREVEKTKAAARAKQPAERARKMKKPGVLNKLKRMKES